MRFSHSRSHIFADWNFQLALCLDERFGLVQMPLLCMSVVMKKRSARACVCVGGGRGSAYSELAVCAVQMEIDTYYLLS